jgi:hypothetical protein
MRKSDKVRFQPHLDQVFHHLSQLLVLAPTLVGFMMRFNILYQLRDRARMLNRQSGKLSKLSPKLGTLRPTRRKQSLFQHVDADKI